MARRNEEMLTRTEIVNMLIKAGAPVAIGKIKGGFKQTRQTIYNHLEKMVKEKIVISEMGEDGKKYYRLQTIFYNEDILNVIKYNMLPLIHLTENKMENIEADSVEILYLILDIVKPDFKQQ